MNQSFPKAEKLKSKKHIERLFAEGKSISKFPLRLVYLKTGLPEETRIQAAVSASKRNFKKAVDRNRIKRLLREAYRLNKYRITEETDASYAFMILYLGREIPEYEKIDHKMKQLLALFLEKETGKKI
ncbi:ribonuclease P protein component [Sinomicrobium weinanense]|uniref:Ribonuclease P protein component n=1 Tax=Sinomicrobium weinanense TaxID=2842200 RepID=A0A926Q185_9FLAO|nr:ribonuclease P protein component [Sinomicrobium weinanense]MBC9794589.1 ribonuclease P protein component [Sinomicrobium weinanense]MBU3124074.1 ribonuclease P protein component [Sinomicrobium weinanense]